MVVEYLVWHAEAEHGAWARVRAEQLHQSWETRQAALDKLGQQAWDLYTTIDGPTKARGGPGEHDGEGFMLKRRSSSTGVRTPVPEPMPEPSNF
jgi:hypothetical protein